MTALSNALSAITESLSGYEKTGLMLSPEAVTSLRALLGTATTDARSLERMLERRLRASEFPMPPNAPAIPHSNVVEFRPRGATA